MLYPYHCIKCGQDIEIVKSMHESGREELCPICEIILERIWTAPQVIGASVENAEYNPGLGKVVKNKKHREELCKKMGVVEIGNDYKTPDKIHEKHDQQRAERSEARYAKALKEIE